jgi:GT2 family glycosyltransferase
MLNNTGIWVIIPNWNGGKMTLKCLESLKSQTKKHSVIVVDNASEDNSVELIQKIFPDISLIKNDTNLGFAGGVNTGIRQALGKDAKYIVLLNNDVVLEKNWLEETLKPFADNKIGAVTGKLLNKNGKKVDNTGDEYSIWGLTIPRQRGLAAEEASGSKEEVFGVCAGAAAYRAEAIKDVGLFDQRFFAYYEDTDFNFRLQLRGWKIIYQPKAVGYHATGSTGSTISGFTTFQTIKNLPLLLWKNVPLALMPKILPRFLLAYGSILLSTALKTQFLILLKGLLWVVLNIPHGIIQRAKIQHGRKVDAKYINSVLYQGLPPNASRMRKLFYHYKKII